MARKSKTTSPILLLLAALIGGFCGLLDLAKKYNK